jgi:hypothetical protein
VTTERYRRLHEKYLSDAQTLLESDAQTLLEELDFPQASEKFWGAVAQMIKSIAANRRWRHGSHADLRRAIRELSAESRDTEFLILFASAEALHANFYEDFMSPTVVRESAEEARLLIGKMRSLSEPGDSA